MVGLLSRAGKLARKAVLDRGKDGNEWATYARGDKVSDPWTSGSPVAVKLPYDARWRGIEVHHNHPSPQSTVHPLSMQDMSFMLEAQRKAPGWVKSLYAHETGGGTSVAKRAGRSRHRNAQKALEAGSTAAAKYAPNTYGVGNFEDYALGVAAGKQRLMKYAYDPHMEAEELLLANDARIRQAVDAAYRAMHGPIHGLPYPITWGGIGATGAGLGAAGAAYGMSR